jgi:hypothetical protein
VCGNANGAPGVPRSAVGCGERVATRKARLIHRVDGAASQLGQMRHDGGEVPENRSDELELQSIARSVSERCARGGRWLCGVPRDGRCAEK